MGKFKQLMALQSKDQVKNVLFASEMIGAVRGIDPTTGQPLEPIIFGLGGNTQRMQAGYPLGAYFQVPYTFADANNDGIIGVDEVTMGDSARFLGNPFPTRELSVQTNLTVWKNFRLSGLVDYRGGFYNFNATEMFRCGSFANCEAA